MGLSGQGTQGSSDFVHRHAYPVLRDFQSAGWKPRTSQLLGAGMDGVWPGSGAGRAVGLFLASWVEEARQAGDTQPLSLLPFFGCFSNLQNNLFSRLIDQSQDARTAKYPYHKNTAASQPQVAPFLLPLEAIFALV